MSRVEEFRIFRDFPKSGEKSTKRMIAHVARRQEGRIRVMSEAPTHNPERTPKREVSKREKLPDKEKMKIIFHWPLTSGRKRY